MEPVAEWKADPGGPDYERVRRRVVTAAEEIVRADGVAALRLDSVADRVGLHRSSLYRYFDSKEELLTAVMVGVVFRLGRTVIDRLGEDAAPDRFLTEGLALALAELAEDPLPRSLMAPSGTELMARVGGRSLTEGLRPLVEPVFVAAAEGGLLRPGVTTGDALRWLQIVATGLMRAPEVVDGRDELTALLQRMLLPALFDDASGASAGPS